MAHESCLTIGRLHVAFERAVFGKTVPELA